MRDAKKSESISFRLTFALLFIPRWTKNHFWRKSKVKMRLRKAHLEEAIAGIDKRFQRKRCSQREPPKGRSQAFYPKVFL